MTARGPKPRPAPSRFWPQVDRSGDCWNWLGAKQAGGYGRFMVTSRPRVLVLAHRYSYEQIVGPIEGDLTIDHLCRNTSCVNPDHLEPISRELNAFRASRNATKTHCDKGHEFTTENIYRSPSRPNVRCCRECRRADSVARHLVRKESA